MALVSGKRETYRDRFPCSLRAIALGILNITSLPIYGYILPGHRLSGSKVKASIRPSRNKYVAVSKPLNLENSKNPQTVEDTMNE